MAPLAQTTVKLNLVKPSWARDVLFQRGVLLEGRIPTTIARPRTLSFPSGPEVFPAIPDSTNTALFMAERLDPDGGCGCAGVAASWGPVSTGEISLLDVPLWSPVVQGRLTWTSPASSVCRLGIFGAGLSTYFIDVLTARNEVSLDSLGVPKGHSYVVEMTCLAGFASVDEAVSERFNSQFIARLPFVRVSSDAFRFDW